MEKEESVQHFLDLIKQSRRGKFKVYIGMIAGVGKTFRMLQEAHQLLDSGVDVQVGYVETHGRTATEALLQGLPVIPRAKIFYKGKELEEMDLQAILHLSLCSQNGKKSSCVILTPGIQSWQRPLRSAVLF